MTSNLTSTRTKRRTTDPMRDHDALPQHLRQWACNATLPWSARSIRRTWAKALANTGCQQAALARMQAVEAATIAKESAQIWGNDHP